MDLLFPPSSRYYGIATAVIENGQGQEIAYLRRRFVPPPERFAAIGDHKVEQGDRLDNVTARYLDDPEQFWRLCDANRAMRPDELIEQIGRHLRIALPEGIPGPPRA